MLSRSAFRTVLTLRAYSSHPPFFSEKKGREAPKDSTWQEPKKMPMTPGTPHPSSIDPLAASDRVEAFGSETAKSGFIAGLLG